MRLEDLKLGQIVRLETNKLKLNIGKVYGIVLGYNSDINKYIVYKLCSFCSYESVDVTENTLKKLALDLAKLALTETLDIDRFYAYRYISKMVLIDSLPEEEVSLWLTKSSFDESVKNALNDFEDIETVKKKVKERKEKEKKYLDKAVQMLTKPFDSYEKTLVFKRGNIYFESESRKRIYIFVQDNEFLFYDLKEINMDTLNSSLVLSDRSMICHVLDVDLGKLGYLYDTGFNILDLEDNLQHLHNFFTYIR